MWGAYIKGFRAYLQLERSLSDNTVEAYMRDVELLEQHLSGSGASIGPDGVKMAHLQSLLKEINEIGLSVTTQARVLSGIRSFYRYLLLEEVVTVDPTELLESPKTGRKLPHVLSVEEIDMLVGAIDHSKPEGVRNRAMMEVMYGCGLRVSELTGLRISGLYLEAGFVRVTGKGDKERLVPIGGEAVKHIELYRRHVRSQLTNIGSAYTDFLFLSKFGRPLSRVMVFMVLKDLVHRAGLPAEVHPHTLRHSFATHMVERGADLRAVQEMLGHKSITTTEIYTHLDQTFLRQTLEKYHPRYK